MDENTYGAWLPDTSKRDEAELKRLAELEASYPVIQEVIAWHNEQIATFRNPQVIEGVNNSTDAETIKTAVLFAQTMLAGYEQKLSEFEARFEQYLTKKEGVENV